MNIVVVSSVGENILELYDGLPGPQGPAGPAGPAGTTNHLLLTNIGVNSHAQIDSHIANTSNPHATTKFQVGLGNVQNVDNTDPFNIVQSPSYRFVTDTEKTYWNAKEPAIPTGLTYQFWRGDKTWASPTKADVGLSNVPNVDATNPANIIQTTSYRFVTDAEKSQWNSAGIGVPSGGLTGQVLAKNSNTSYDISWVTRPLGDMISTNNLSDVANVTAARNNIGAISNEDSIINALIFG